MTGNESVSNLPEYKIPEWDDYECQATGRCCHGWLVGVSESKRREIEEALEDHPHPKWGKTMPINEEGDFDSLRVEEGHCPYLTDDGLCWLHREFDGETKPDICQSFPRETNETPLGTFKNIQISCVTSTRMLANPNYAISPSVVSPPPDTGTDLDPFHFDPDTPISPKTYLTLETTILEIISRNTGSVGQRLAVAGQFLRTTSRRLDQAPDGQRFKRLNKRFRERDLPEMNGSLEGHAGIIAPILEYREEFIGQLKQLGTHREIIQLIETLNETFGFNADSPDRVAERLKKARDNHWRPSINQFNHVLEHYLTRKIWSKTLTSDFSLTGSLNVLASMFALIRLTAMASAQQNGTELERWQLLNAITEIERNFTHAGENQFLWHEILERSELTKRWFIPYLAIL